MQCKICNVFIAIFIIYKIKFFNSLQMKHIDKLIAIYYYNISILNSSFFHFLPNI